MVKYELTQKHQEQDAGENESARQRAQRGYNQANTEIRRDRYLPRHRRPTELAFDR